MTENYKVGYSVDALDDLRQIYKYIADELLVPDSGVSFMSSFVGGDISLKPIPICHYGLPVLAVPITPLLPAPE